MLLWANKKNSLTFLILACFFAFSPSLFNQFTNWDDDKFLTDNPFVQNLDFHHLKAIFSAYFEGSYQPLTMLSFALEHYFFKFNPFIYHLDNLILHVINVCLVFFLLSRLTRDLTIAFFTALFFALSPLRVESVAWISERKDVLFALFFLSSLIVYVKRLFWPCFILFILACLAKPQAVCLPFAFLAIDYWQRRGEGLIPWSKMWPFFAAALVFFLVNMAGALPYCNLIHQYNFIDKIFFISFALILYAVKIFIPYSLSCVYPYPYTATGYSTGIIYVAPVLVLCWGAFILRSCRGRPVIVTGHLFFAATILLPLANIAVGGYFMNDRYTYLPSIGLYWMMTDVMINAVRSKYPNRMKYVFAAMIFYAALMGAMSFKYSKVWYDSVSLWSDTIRQYPQAAFIYDHRGTAYAQKGQDDLGLKDFNRAIELDPHFASAYNNRGTIYNKEGKINLAYDDFSRAIQIDPSYAYGYFNRSEVNLHLNKPYDALMDALKARSLGIALPEGYWVYLKHANGMK